jgi:hypothetical protein
MAITGGCRCRAVRYGIEAEPITSRHCWCRDCQYIGAGAGTVNVFFPSYAVKIEGALSDYVSQADSGNLMHRRFCPACGTPVFTQSEARLHFIGVRAGTLDDPDIGKPAMTIWTASAPSWAAFETNIPHEAGQSPPPQDGSSAADKSKPNPTMGPETSKE